MANKTSPQQELREFIDELNALSRYELPSKHDAERIGALKSMIAACSKNSLPPTDQEQRCNRFFADLFRNKLEMRTSMEAGSESLSYSQGQEGGYYVPTEFYKSLIEGLSQNDPLLDRNLVTLIESDTYTLRPIQIPGIDLSTYSAALIAENAQQVGQTPPTVTGKHLGGYIFKATLPVTFELEEDAFTVMQILMRRFFTVAFARGIGGYLITGTGSSQPQGVLVGAASSGQIITSPSVITATDIENIYFSLNKAYRSQPKCAWVMSDVMYQQVRKAKDDDNRPLIHIVEDKIMLMDKPVLISPTMPAGASQKSVVFGDLSHYVVRVSNMVMNRTTQNSIHGTDTGEGLYIARMRADAVVFDPTGGTTPPIVYATAHS